MIRECISCGRWCPIENPKDEEKVFRDCPHCGVTMVLVFTSEEDFKPLALGPRIQPPESYRI